MLFFRKRHSLETGFTLLEVLVAVTLIAVMALGMYGLLRISLHSWAKGTGYIDVNQQNRNVMDSVQKQLASVCPLYTTQLEMQNQGGGTRYPIFMGDQNNLQFLSFNSLQFVSSPGLTFVCYEVIQADNGTYSLVERETPYTGLLPDEATLQEARVTTVFENLTDCGFEYFTLGDANNSPQWVADWNSQTLMKVPVAIQLTMITRDAQGNSIDRSIVAPITTDAIDPNAQGGNTQGGGS
jgi:prepilin-type N-terminal cleavage/methylation domain-containing protein